MRIAKPMLLVLTPVGVGFGLYEAWRLAGGLVYLMATLLAVVAVGFASIIVTIRRERAARARESQSEIVPNEAES
jgi:hypothetical protein